MKLNELVEQGVIEKNQIKKNASELEAELNKNNVLIEEMKEKIDK
jgi:hypothetical protein